MYSLTHLSFLASVALGRTHRNSYETHPWQNVCPQASMDPDTIPGPAGVSMMRPGMVAGGIGQRIAYSTFCSLPSASDEDAGVTLHSRRAAACARSAGRSFAPPTAGKGAGRELEPDGGSGSCCSSRSDELVAEVAASGALNSSRETSRLTERCLSTSDALTPVASGREVLVLDADTAGRLVLVPAKVTERASEAP